jgi:hypothetical protein
MLKAGQSPSRWNETSIAARISDPPPTAQTLCAFLGIYATASMQCDTGAPWHAHMIAAPVSLGSGATRRAGRIADPR